MAWATFALLMVLHMVANVRAVRCLELTSINRTRADILLHDFVHVCERGVMHFSEFPLQRLYSRRELASPLRKTWRPGSHCCRPPSHGWSTPWQVHYLCKHSAAAYALVWALKPCRAHVWWKQPHSDGARGVHGRRQHSRMWWRSLWGRCWWCWRRA